MEEKVIETADISLKELLLKIRSGYRYILSKWVIIIAFSFLGGTLGILYSWLTKPVYTATTTFVLEVGEGGGGGLGQYAGLASMVGIDVGGGGNGGIFQGDNILELYKSRNMIRKALLTEAEFKGKKQLLIDRFIDFNELRKSWSDRPELKNIKFSKDTLQSVPSSRLQDSIIGTIINEINKSYLIVTKPDKKLSIIEVDVKSTDEDFSKNFNDEIVQTVNDFYVQTKTKKSLKNVAILQQKTDSVRTVMNGAIYTSAIISDATPNLNVTRQVQRQAPVQRSQFTAETNKAVLGQLIQNLELSKIALRKETPLIQVVDQPVYPLDKKRTGKLKGLVIGGFLAGFLTVIVISVKRLLKIVMA